MVRDTTTLIGGLKIQFSVTAPYEKNMPVAAIPKIQKAAPHKIWMLLMFNLGYFVRATSFRKIRK
ncbi:hypothetical protein Riv7116_6241 [Rivularia sp. PCC 7116]|uniref:hypothetical protein n=1 Tax=Rivularia sp. PCC 7116 TaxID=373994 RepID=UPI00029ED87C|nr:hypothetical protein [Rivularia sp. PCC 7116]AFY58590.1 hypothetical protein Riv7116_6241 [Rivularia sp. PCC 7116]